MKKLLEGFLFCLLAWHAHGATLATDDFNRANETPIASPWVTPVTGSDPMNLTSNRLVGSLNDNENYALYDGSISWPNNQWSEVQLAAVGAVDGGPLVRGTSGGMTGYFASGEGGVITLYRVVAGAYTVIGTPASSYALNDLIRVEAEGTTIRVKKNGVTVITATDATLSSGQPGAFVYTTGLQLDNFQAGDFSGGAPSPLLLIRRRN